VNETCSTACRSWHRRRPATWWAALLLACAGCAGYRMGTASLFPADIQTVYVPVFQSDSYRRGMGERLTELVIKEIEERTPYKVVSSPDADSILTGRITNDTKRVTIEDQHDQPRDVQMNFNVQVTWVDRKGDLVSQGGAVPIPAQTVELGQTSDQIAEFGQSTATAQQQSLERIARQIVSLMENPW
jgi:lipopolysaccharide assembly LptE-like protein